MFALRRSKAVSHRAPHSPANATGIGTGTAASPYNTSVAGWRQRANRLHGHQDQQRQPRLYPPLPVYTPKATSMKRELFKLLRYVAEDTSQERTTRCWPVTLIWTGTEVKHLPQGPFLLRFRSPSATGFAYYEVDASNHVTNIQPATKWNLTIFGPYSFPPIGFTAVYQSVYGLQVRFARETSCEELEAFVFTPGTSNTAQILKEDPSEGLLIWKRPPTGYSAASPTPLTCKGTYLKGFRTARGKTYELQPALLLDINERQDHFAIPAEALKERGLEQNLWATIRRQVSNTWYRIPFGNKYDKNVFEEVVLLYVQPSADNVRKQRSPA